MIVVDPWLVVLVFVVGFGVGLWIGYFGLARR